ncbi:hypothetical protein PGT21_032875 [Puccinia graminis f. sp. tritici]|uniref:Uncharacterized protein n=1 Tax=Puccinia graminis f. sp. tritici TaxID=56615 RepID=A0A5B0QKA0_PUCGR|nr:hypothetical protein PGT21_032875 [Puccinia graminis f. sp. tritici]
MTQTTHNHLHYAGHRNLFAQSLKTSTQFYIFGHPWLHPLYTERTVKPILKHQAYLCIQSRLIDQFDWEDIPLRLTDISQEDGQAQAFLEGVGLESTYWISS